MSGATVRKYKWFWHDQDVEQEQWLRAMALQGLHLKSVSFVTWTFTRGAPADIVYRVDFNQSVPAAYRQLLEDAGWEHAAEAQCWHYWRTAANGAQPELFTDAASKSAKFKRLLGALVMCLVPTLIMISNPQRASYFLTQLSWPFLVAIGLGLAVIGIAIGRLVVRLWRTRQVA